MHAVLRLRVFHRVIVTLDVVDGYALLVDYLMVGVLARDGLEPRSGGCEKGHG